MRCKAVMAEDGEWRFEIKFDGYRRTLSLTTNRPETYEKIRSLSDKATEREGRPVSFAEIIERGIERLE